jgi:hypothetical protein
VAWSILVLLLVAVALSMQFTEEIDWSAGDFIIASILLFGSLGAYKAVSRLSSDSTVRAGFALAIAASLFLVWANGAVGLTDSDADALYPVVVIFALMGSILVRFRPRGMARIMFLTSVATASVGIIALIAGIVPPHNDPFDIIRIAFIFGVPFAGSALLFWLTIPEKSDGSSG